MSEGKLQETPTARSTEEQDNLDRSTKKMKKDGNDEDLVLPSVVFREGKPVESVILMDQSPIQNSKGDTNTLMADRQREAKEQSERQSTNEQSDKRKSRFDILNSLTENEDEPEGNGIQTNTPIKLEPVVSQTNTVKDSVENSSNTRMVGHQKEKTKDRKIDPIAVMGKKAANVPKSTNGTKRVAKSPQERASIHTVVTSNSSRIKIDANTTSQKSPAKVGNNNNQI
ncbi:uncharacterized protein G2W53_016242 [Senna tora]|uniref:Uncharacterized protein n=1 Tax=Senna tora TaxID=362788 RepID=A0A834WLB7_9FABA|nr:uncharacterized protein G2W53_016242 [Senna tora]